MRSQGQTDDHRTGDPVQRLGLVRDRLCEQEIRDRFEREVWRRLGSKAPGKRSRLEALRIEVYRYEASRIEDFRFKAVLGKGKFEEKEVASNRAPLSSPAASSVPFAWYLRFQIAEVGSELLTEVRILQGHLHRRFE